MNVEKRALPVAILVQNHHVPNWAAEAAGIKFFAELPFTPEISHNHDMGGLPDECSTPKALAWNRQVRKIH